MNLQAWSPTLKGGAHLYCEASARYNFGTTEGEKEWFFWFLSDTK